MVKTSNFEQLLITSQEELRNWLSKNHAQKESTWLVTYKKSIESKYVSVDQVLDELLCFGWIDGIRRKVDDDKTMQLISPRKVQHWSGTYKKRFAKLEKLALVHQSGFDSVTRSKENGSWAFMDDVDKLIKPKDFIEELNKYPYALRNFDTFGPSSQRFILRWIKIAKTETTRLSRIKEASRLADINQKIDGI